jgi:hypothetical protein
MINKNRKSFKNEGQIVNLTISLQFCLQKTIVFFKTILYNKFARINKKN